MDALLAIGAVGFGAWMLARLVLALRRDAEELRRSDRGLCRGCGHDLAGATGGHCMHCGRTFQPFEAVSVKPGLCRSCGYDLRTQRAGDRCPECGAGVPGGA